MPEHWLLTMEFGYTFLQNFKKGNELLHEIWKSPPLKLVNRILRYCAQIVYVRFKFVHVVAASIL